MVQGKITESRYTDHPGGCHSIWTNQRPTSIIPHFYAGCPSFCNPPTLSWLGTGTKYAGLHTQWHGHWLEYDKQTNGILISVLQFHSCTMLMHNMQELKRKKSDEAGEGNGKEDDRRLDCFPTVCSKYIVHKCCIYMLQDKTGFSFSLL